LPTWHLIEGEAGSAYARDHHCAAVIVDALRASATAAALLDCGATEILVVGEVEDALRARRECWSEALLFGERGGLPPGGFDFGNSPSDAHHARGRRVIFTTSNGSVRLLQAWGAPSIHFGTTTNAQAVVELLATQPRDVVLIPAGKVGHTGYDALEDWAAATAIAMLAGARIGEGALYYRDTRQQIELDGIAALFESAPHANELRKVGLAEDIALCARMNTARAVPTVSQRGDDGLVLTNASRD